MKSEKWRFRIESKFTFSLQNLLHFYHILSNANYPWEKIDEIVWELFQHVLGTFEKKMIPIAPPIIKIICSHLYWFFWIKDLAIIFIFTKKYLFSIILSIFKKVKLSIHRAMVVAVRIRLELGVAEELNWWFGAHAALVSSQVWFPVHTWWLTTIYNYSSRGSKTCVTHTNIQAKDSNTKPLNKHICRMKMAVISTQKKIQSFFSFRWLKTISGKNNKKTVI